MAIKAATLADFKRLVAATDAIHKAHLRIAQKYDDLSTRTAQAIKAGDGAACSLYLRAAGAELKQLDATLASARAARAAIRKLQEDEDFVEQRLEDTAALTNVVTQAIDAMLRLFPGFKRLEAQADKQMQSLGSADAAARVELVELDKEVRKAIRKIGGVYDQARAIEDKAHAAVKANNARALADTQKALLALDIDRALSEYNGTTYWIKQLQIKVDDKKCSAELCGDVRDGTARLLTELGRGSLLVQFESLRKRMAAATLKRAGVV